MRQIAAQVLREHDVIVHRFGALLLPAPDVLPQLVRGGCQRLRDWSAAQACSSSTADSGQRRGMRLSAVDQRLSPGHSLHARGTVALEDRWQHVSWSERPAYGTPRQHQQQRSIRLFEAFSKEAKEVRKKKLHEDLQRGYWDDFKELRDTGGKMFAAPDRLAPADAAPAFPGCKVLRPDGSETTLPQADGSVTASLVCIAFRAGAEDMITGWSGPFGSAFGQQPGVSVVELSLVESAVMSVWPFRSLILRGRRSTLPSDAPPGAAPTVYLFAFGDAEPLCRGLGMTNRLSGYVFLVDCAGLVRWRGSGQPETMEVQSMLRCTEELLAEVDGVSEQLEQME